MKIIEVPVYDEDGSVKFMAQLAPNEAKSLLEFALNFTLAVGAQTINGVKSTQELDD